MIRLVRDLRLIPVVLFATACLLALKLIGLALDGGYTLGGHYTLGGLDGATFVRAVGAPESVPAEEAAGPAPKTSWARDMFSFGDVTGSIAAENQAKKNAAKSGEESSAKPAEAPKDAPETRPAGRVVPLDVKERTSPAERALLERLGERRQELEARSRELEIRENLLKSAERRIDGRVNELKDMESRVDGAAARRDETSARQFKNLVTMYENMKAKDAAKIFDRLEMRILVEVASQINPRRMSDILAQMQTEAAERLTVEMANRATPPDRAAAPAAADLPKIEGRPR